MSYINKLQSIIFSKRFLLVGFFVTSLIGVVILHGCEVDQEISISLKGIQNTIQEYEQSGDYAKALEASRAGYDYLVDKNLLQHSEEFSKTVTRMEEQFAIFGSSKLLFDKEFQPRNELLALLKAAGMEPLNKSENALIQINNWAQGNLLRKGERWDEQVSKFEGLKSEILPGLKKLGFVDPALPHFKHYQGALVHGALFSTVCLRLYYLVEQWQQGVRFSRIYFLSGERPLEVQYENPEVFRDDSKSLLKMRKESLLGSLKFPETESQMTEFVWENFEIPEDMRREVQVHFINAPLKKDQKTGKTIRPNTNDTIDAWLKTQPAHGTYLAVSNAPHINRQDFVIRMIAPKEYTFETVGPAAKKEQKVAIFLDEIARLIFEVKRYSENNVKN